MKVTLEKTRVVKSQMGRAKVWFPDGSVREVYFVGPNLDGSKAKYIERSVVNGVRQVKFQRGRVFQDSDLKPYFLPKS